MSHGDSVHRYCTTESDMRLRYSNPCQCILIDISFTPSQYLAHGGKKGAMVVLHLLVTHSINHWRGRRPRSSSRYWLETNNNSPKVLE